MRAPPMKRRSGRDRPPTQMVRARLSPAAGAVCSGLVGGGALQDEALVAIAAVDKALLVDLQVDAGMAERGVRLARPVARHPRRRDVGDLGREAIRLHGARL